MSPISPIRLNSLKKEEVRDWLNSFEVILTDCDGVLWLHNDVIGKSSEVINKLVKMGKRVYFITNNSVKTRDGFAAKAKTMNFNVGVDNIISTAYLSAHYLKAMNFKKKCYVIGSAAIGQELDAAGIEHCGIGPDPLTVSLDTFIEKDLTFDPEVEAVIVGFDENFSYPKMVKATTYLERPGSIFIGTNLDERIPMPNHVLPSTGTFIKCIETSAERRAVIMGKPSTMITDIYFKELIKNGPKKFLMIGDRMNTDVLFGKNNQFQTLMVETGVHKMHDIMKISIALQTGAENQDLQYQIPDFITESLTDLLEYLD